MKNLHTLATGDLKLLLKIMILKKRQRFNWKVRLGLMVRALNKVKMKIMRMRMRMRKKLRSYWIECVLMK